MAIFKRRDKQKWRRRLREGVWPSMGWRRALSYYWHRVFRAGDSTYEIAAGLAVGMAVSFSPLLGTHVFQAPALAWLIRANWIAAVVGTAAGNPWTFPFLYAAAYKVGFFLCGLAGWGALTALPPDMAGFLDDPAGFVAFMFAHPVKFLLPMMVGGYVCALLVFPVLYGALYFPVRAVRRRYARRRGREV